MACSIFSMNVRWSASMGPVTEKPAAFCAAAAECLCDGADVDVALRAHADAVFLALDLLKR
jgi:hypothetical protein